MSAIDTLWTLYQQQSKRVHNAFRRHTQKTSVPTPKTQLCKTLIFIGIKNVAILVHLNNQPISLKSILQSVFPSQFSAKNQKKYNCLIRAYNLDYQCVTKWQRC